MRCCRLLRSAVAEGDVAEIFRCRSLLPSWQLLVRPSSQISFAYVMWQLLEAFPVIDCVLPCTRCRVRVICRYVQIHCMSVFTCMCIVFLFCGFSYQCLIICQCNFHLPSSCLSTRVFEYLHRIVTVLCFDLFLHYEHVASKRSV